MESPTGSASGELSIVELDLEMDGYHECTPLSNISNITNGTTVPDFRKLFTIVSMIQAIGYVSIVIFGIGLNSFLLLLIIKFKTLHQRGYFIAMQILISNLLLTFSLLPTTVVASLLNQWILGDGMCNTFAAFQIWMQIERWLLTLLLALDRTLCVWKPLTYDKEFGNKLVPVLSVVSWIAGFVLALVPVHGIGSCYQYYSALKLCSFNRPNHPACTLYVLFLGTFLIVFGGVTPALLYLALYCKARKINNTIINAQAAWNLTHSGNKSAARKRKATFIVLFFTVLGLSIPFYAVLILQIVTALASKSFTIIGDNLFWVTHLLYHGLVIADPLSMMKNKEVKETILRFKTSIRMY